MLSPARSGGAIEFHKKFSARPQISHVIFDFDGTVSWLRHGWPELMYRVVRPYFSIGPDESEESLHDWMLHDILSLNGKPSIFQLVHCAEQARARGGLAPDPQALLSEYQQQLEIAIAERTTRIQQGIASPDEFVIHGARDLLEKLRGRGLVLIVLSGTLEHRVKTEAALLELADFFGQHIYGSTGDLTQSSKQAVIERLLVDEGISGENLLSFGDGPVEIQLTCEVGGLAVGVASDEAHNGSGLADRHKRELLLAAGAHMLVPDFRDTDALIDSLVGK